jgi:hypothetical protein
VTAWWARFGVGLITVLLMPRTALACELPTGWTSMKSEADASMRAALSQAEASIQVGQPFAIDIAVCALGTVEAIKVDAMMPRHRHGMNYTPKITRVSSNRFRADPLLFHMPGLWRITMKAYRAGKPVHFSLDMSVK